MNSDLTKHDSVKMGQRRHVQRKRKRGQIDLNSLSKKSRKDYRSFGKRGHTDTKNTRDQPQTEEPAAAVPDISVQEEDLSSSSDEELANPYSQLVSTLQGGRGAASYKDSDEEEEEEDEEDLSPDDESNPPENLSEDIAETDVRESDGENDQSEQEGESSDESDDQSEDEVIEPEENVKDFSLKESDPFSIHFEQDLPDDVADEMGSASAWKRQELKMPHLGPGVMQWKSDAHKPAMKYKHGADLANMHVKQALVAEAGNANRKLGKVDLDTDKASLTPFQSDLFGIMNEYQDLLYSERTPGNSEEIRLVYCMHALNHVLKTRSRVIAHNTKIKQKSNLSVDEEHRDQGLTRPKVLIVLPFRESAKRVVDMFISLLQPSDQVMMVSNKARFFKEYGSDPEADNTVNKKPEDFQALFAGNIDDYFRIGLGVAKKTLKLYSKFYTADIILASPLGLRTLIGSEGDKERDYDFLSSIEMLIVDQADVFMMQNWDHVLHLFSHLHLQPKESHGLDFSRVRMWTLNGWSKYYRQNLVFSSVPVPEITALFNKQCHNYAGKVQIARHVSTGTICQITVQLPQVFQRIESSSFAAVPDDRFEYFIKKVLPQHRESIMSRTFIFIPSYFDFVRLRNYCKKEEVDAVFINEYGKDKIVSKARNLFYHGKVPILLYTERFHFFKRLMVRGIRHIIFYGLPQYPHFYSELCNMMRDPRKAGQAVDYTCTILYSKYEAQKLAEIVGTDRASRMINAAKTVHMFVTGENG